MLKCKFAVYQLFLGLQRVYWRLLGARKITAFGYHLKLSPETVFPSCRKLKLPRGGYLSEIVRYADFVQFHAICSRIDQMVHPPVVVDVGAHHGAYAVLLGKMVEKKGGRVLALEPNPVSYKILLENVEKNNLKHVVTCLPLAAADKSCKVKISLEDSQSSINFEGNDENLVNVEAKTMTEIFSGYDIKYVSLLIVDVEGAEMLVLKGIPWDEVEIKNLFCEMHPYAWPEFGYDRKEMTAYIVSQGWSCLDMYLREYRCIDEDRYIGPCLLMKK